MELNFKKKFNLKEKQRETNTLQQSSTMKRNKHREKKKKKMYNLDLFYLKVSYLQNETKLF